GPGESARTSSFHRVLSRLQERLMSDYIPGENFATTSKKIWREWNWKKITGLGFFFVAFVFVALAIVGIGIWYLAESRIAPSKSGAGSPDKNKTETVAKIQPAPPAPTGVVPRAIETPTAAPVAPSATPAQLFGSLFIDSAPQGETFEIIDSTSK